MKRKLDFLLRSKNCAVIFEDGDLIAIDKPSSLLVLPDRYDDTIPNLYGILKEELGEIFVVHRIDKETSGVILFAKNSQAHSSLSQQFESREVSKTYRAIVTGRPAEMAGKIDVAISESKNHPGVMKADPKHGKPSVTNYKVMELFDGYAEVEAFPESGRTHQIRVHLAYSGFPVVCDKVYGDGRPFFLSEIKPRYYSEGEERPLLARTALHAMSIGFTHPSSGERTVITCELPKDMRSVLKYLHKFRSNGHSITDMRLDAERA